MRTDFVLQSDNYWASRYLLTFENASIANEWWELVQEEYPDQGVRNGAQLFSFSGDNFLSKPSTNKRFKHLKTKWMYTQIGDATGTSGRNQQIIPIQDESGNVLGGSMNGGGVEGFDATALSRNLEKMQDLMSQTLSQVQKLAEEQAANQARMDDLRALVQENAEQIKALSSSTNSNSKSNADPSSSISMPELQSFLHQTSTQIQSLTTTNRDLATNLENILITQAPKQNGVPSVCTHNIKPPPRKLDRPVLGYDYGPGPGSGPNGASLTSEFLSSPVPSSSQPSTPKRNKSKVRFAGVDGDGAEVVNSGKMESLTRLGGRGKRKGE